MIKKVLNKVRHLVTRFYIELIFFLVSTEFILYDLNRTVNEEIGREVFDFYGFSTATDNNIVITFKNVSVISV